MLDILGVCRSPSALGLQTFLGVCRSELMAFGAEKPHCKALGSMEQN